MTRSASGVVVHVIRAGTASAALNSYLRGHDDAVSWTADVGLALAFFTHDAAKRFAARRLGGAYHVAEVDRSAFRRVMIDEEVDDLPERYSCAGPERAAPDCVLITRAQGEALAAHRKAIRRSASSPWAA